MHDLSYEIIMLGYQCTPIQLLSFSSEDRAGDFAYCFFIQNNFKHLMQLYLYFNHIGDKPIITDLSYLTKLSINYQALSSSEFPPSILSFYPCILLQLLSFAETLPAFVKETFLILWYCLSLPSYWSDLISFSLIFFSNNYWLERKSH